MTLDDVHPDLREATARMARMPDLPRPLIRIAVRLMRPPAVAGATVHRVRVDRVRLRVYRRDRRRAPGALLWIHGGGLLFGDAKQDEALCGSTAARLGVVVVSANYRTAPEHPFPAALDDLHEAWVWVQRNAARLGVDPGRVVVGGESAGAGLAAALVQRLHDEGGTQPAGQWLFAPMLDDRTAARRDLDDLRHFVWDNTRNREGWTAYLGGPVGTETLPPYAAAARRADLTGLPPAYLTWGDVELFAAEDAAYADALRAGGVEVTTDVVEGAPHGFENWARDTPVARATVERAQRWIAGLLGTRPAAL